MKSHIVLSLSLLFSTAFLSADETWFCKGAKKLEEIAHSPLGKEARVYMDAGDLVPDELTTKMLIDEVNKHLDSNGILFDGYPRTIAQAEALDAFLPTIGSSVTATVALEADDNILVERLLERGKTSGRVDDQDEEKIRNRYQEYNEKTAPLMGYYKEQNKFHAVNGIGTIQEITERLTSVIDNL